ncbi:EI24 domain-containing protein [Schumannella luteola]
MAPRQQRPSVVREFLSGVALLFRGLRVWATAPRLMVLGMIPALVVGLAFVAGIITLGANVERLAEVITPFAAAWDEPFRTGTRIVAGLALLASAVTLAIYAYTTITLLVGQPFYERIWMHVERRFGAVPESGLTTWRALWRGIGAGIRIIIPTVLLALGLFLLGFVPAVGPVLVVVLGALVGGWLLALELTGLAFDGRGRTLRERRTALRTRRARTVGFGAASYLVFLIPLGAVVMMPAAVAGGTLLARSALGEPITDSGRGEPDRTAP